MRHIKIRTRLLLGFLIVLMLLFFVSIFSMNRMHYLANFTKDLYEHPLQVSNAARDVEIYIFRIHLDMKDLTNATNSTEMKLMVDEVDRLEKDVLKKLDIILNYYKGDLADIRLLINKFESWKAIRDEVILLVNKNERAAAETVIKEKEILYVHELADMISGVTRFASGMADTFMNGAVNSASQSYLIVGVFDAVAIVISVIIAFLITGSIIRPVKVAVSAANRLAQGDISGDIIVKGRDELSSMLEAMKKMTVNLREQLMEMAEGISVLAGSAAQISSTTSQLAATTKEVAASVSEVVVSMKEVKQTTELSNEKAMEMTERATNVVETSRGGEAAVAQTIQLINTIQDQMLSIAESVVGLSEQGLSIGEIIAAVDDVADQSRLLAVNAAIEAVKAGEQGIGFTVVASEIKNLAEQSKQSTSQVRTILTDIQKATSAAVLATEKGSKAVEAGVRQAGHTGNAIQMLGENIKQSSLTAKQIEATSRQQTAGIDQVFRAMENINRAIEQNADSALQLDNSARDLNILGNKLQNIVSKYKS